MSSLQTENIFIDPNNKIKANNNLQQLKEALIREMCVTKETNRVENAKLIENILKSVIIIVTGEGEIRPEISELPKEILQLLLSVLRELSLSHYFLLEGVMILLLICIIAGSIIMLLINTMRLSPFSCLHYEPSISRERRITHL